MKGKLLRGLTVGEIEADGKKGFGFETKGDFTFNQMACFIAYVAMDLMVDGLEEKYYDGMVEKIKTMMLSKDPEYIWSEYLKACKNAGEDVEEMEYVNSCMFLEAKENDHK